MRGAGSRLAHAIVLAVSTTGVFLAAAPHAAADEVICGEVVYPNGSGQAGTLTLDAGGPTCADAWTVLNAHFAEVLGDDSLGSIPSGSSLGRYHCYTNFSMSGGMSGLTECRYIIGEGNDADDAMEILVVPR